MISETPATLHAKVARTYSPRTYFSRRYNIAQVLELCERVRHRPPVARGPWRLNALDADRAVVVQHAAVVARVSRATDEDPSPLPDVTIDVVRRVGLLVRRDDE